MALHSNTKALITYWEHMRAGRPVPAQRALAREAADALLTHTFVLKRVDDEHATFVAAGAGLHALFRREFMDHNWLSLWQGHDRAFMKALMAACVSTPGPSVAIAKAYALNGPEMDIEILLAPLRNKEGQLTRLLGLFQPLSDKDSLKGKPIYALRLTTLAPAMPAPLQLVVDNDRAPGQILCADTRTHGSA